MDAERFDTLARALRASSSRRLTLRGLTALGLTAVLYRDQAEATKRHRKKKDKKDDNKNKRRCASEFPVFCPGLGCCRGDMRTCCPAGCAPAGYRCCTAAQGGGSCPPEAPQCCGPTPQSPQGTCVQSGTLCCASANGGSCPADTPVCCPAGTGPQTGARPGCCEANFPLCCPAESNACAPEGGSCCTAAQGGGSCGPGEQCSPLGCVPI
jgi:hypothetical protein